jgi:hypothetical protein
MKTKAPDNTVESSFDESPESLEERRAADALRAALDGAAHAVGGTSGTPEVTFALALRAATTSSDGSLDHDAFVDAFLTVKAEAEADETEAEAEADETEVAAARATSEALAAGNHPFAEQLRLAAAPRAIDDATHAALVAAALGQAEAPRPKVLRWVRPLAPLAPVAATLALAAGIFLWLRPAPNPRPSDTPLPVAAFVGSRSTQDLFSEPFTPGQSSARIDRIASARGRDLRENRYAAWGLR